PAAPFPRPLRAWPAPLASVLMAARNHGPSAAEAAASILDQDYDRLELIAIDDASDDATADVLEECAATAEPGRMRVVRHERQDGIAETRAHCLSLAQGELIGLLDSDDLWLPGKLGPQVELMVSDPDVGLVHGDYEAFDSATGKPLAWGQGNWDRDADPLVELVRFGNFVMAGSVLVRRKAIDQRSVGFINPGSRSYDDYFLWLTIALDWRIVHEPRRVMRYRRHAENLSGILLAGNVALEQKTVLELFVDRFPPARGRVGTQLR